MAIIKNTTTENGDVLIIKSEVPIIGLIALVSFLDEVDGETINRYFDKEFRYSIDGITYSDFLPLTTANVEAIQIHSSDTFYVEYRYKREGSDNTGTLGFNSIELEGEYQFLTPGQPWDDSNFSTYVDYNGVCTISWAVNVLEKIYKKGLLPKYLDRGTDGTNTRDRDFLDFWRSITHFYGWYVCLARYYRFFYRDPELLEEYIVQRGINVCRTSTDIEQLFYLMQNALDEVRHRGTIQIIKEKGYDHPGSNDSSTSSSLSNSSITDIKQVDGEFLRLICRNVIDEFCFILNRDENVGWNIGNSSPLYKTIDAEKYPIDTIAEIADFNLYPDGDISINEGALLIENVPSGETGGIGGFSEQHFIKVNPYLDYEVSFEVKQDVNVGNLTFGISAFDLNNNPTDLLNVQNNTAQNEFFTEQQLNTTSFQKVSGTIYGVGRVQQYNAVGTTYGANTIVSWLSSYFKATRDVPETIDPSDATYWQVIDASEAQRVLKTSGYLGDNLTFQNTVVKILPSITLDNTSGAGGELEVRNISIKPINTDYSKGFIQTPNILEFWGVNRNLQRSNDTVEKEATKYLFPYNVTSIFKWVQAPGS